MCVPKQPMSSRHGCYVYVLHAYITQLPLALGSSSDPQNTPGYGMFKWTLSIFILSEAPLVKRT